MLAGKAGQMAKMHARNKSMPRGQPNDTVLFKWILKLSPRNVKNFTALSEDQSFCLEIQ